MRINSYCWKESNSFASKPHWQTFELSRNSNLQIFTGWLILKYWHKDLHGMAFPRWWAWWWVLKLKICSMNKITKNIRESTMADLRGCTQFHAVFWKIYKFVCWHPRRVGTPYYRDPGSSSDLVICYFRKTRLSADVHCSLTLKADFVFYILNRNYECWSLPQT